jgi:branched-chain amino acid aminotransferase
MIYLDGELVAPERARIDPRDRGLLLGDGLFETMRARAGRVSLVERHLARLRHGAATLGIPVPLDDDGIARALAEVLQANRLDDAALRLTLTRGPGPRGLAPPADPRPTLMIASAPPPPPKPPARARIVSIRRNEHSPLAGIKSLGHLDNVLAEREAGEDEALLLNSRGRLCEAAAANLFLVVGGVAHTPPVADGALPGVIRSVLLEPGAVETTLLPADLAVASEAFLTNSLIGVRPLIEVDGRRIGDGQPGPLTRTLAERAAQA